VNDRFGHACGDRLLQQVASRVGATLRATDTLARLGGDEFVALLEDCESIADGERVMEKIHEALLPPFELGGGVQLTTSASIGIAHYPNEGDSVQALMFRADAAMYAAKARTSAHGVAPRQGVPVSLHQHDGA
jgi:diguanylate cyclase (GGDEF)-like protein